MKKYAKLICAVLVLALALGLGACGKPAEPKNALEKIKAEGVLTVALSPDFSPMEFVDSSKTGQDQYVGFDVTLAKYLAEELGVKLEIQAMSFDACQTAVSTGSVPMSISGYSWTETRAENYDLSDYYYAGENETEQVLLIRAADAEKYTKPEDFDGKDVGAQNASLQMQLVTEQLPNANCVTIGEIGEYEANVVMMHKDEPELLAAVNAALKKAYDGGLYAGWYADALELAASASAIEVTVED